LPTVIIGRFLEQTKANKGKSMPASIARTLLVTRPPALEPPATAILELGPGPGSLPMAAFPELPFPPDSATAPGPRLVLAEPDPFAPEATPRSALPDPAAHARRLVLAALEVIAGRRPVQQLRPHLTDLAYQRISVHARRPRARPRPDARKHAGLRRTRIHVGRAVICEPADGIVEATVLAGLGGRTRAVALRLEGIDGRWRCPVFALL
jgi:hypothetical protein